MENLEIPSSSSTPYINFNAETGRLLMTGRSIPEDPGEFFERLTGWLEKYFSEVDQETVLEFQLEYANSGSSKHILELLKDLQQYSSQGKNISVIWCYEEDDESIQELGELFDHSVDLPFEIKVLDE